MASHRESRIRILVCVLVLVQSALIGLAHRHCATEHATAGTSHAHLDWFADHDNYDCDCHHEHDADCDCDADHSHPSIVVQVASDDSSPTPSPVLDHDAPLVSWMSVERDALTSLPTASIESSSPPRHCPLYQHLCALRC